MKLLKTMNKELTYTIQFTDKEFDQLVGNLYYYFRHLKYNLELQNCEEGRINTDAKKYLASQLSNVLQLQSKLENIRNKADITNPLYILKEVKINE